MVAYLSTMSLANGPAKNLDYSGQLDASLVIGGLGLSEIVHIFMKMLQNSQIPHLTGWARLVGQ